jgi:hypothetical protein
MADLQWKRGSQTPEPPIAPPPPSDRVTQDQANPAVDDLYPSKLDSAPDATQINENDRDRRSLVDAIEGPLVAEASTVRREVEDDRGLVSDPPSTLPEDTDGRQLFSDFDIDELRSRWSDVQAGFVDSPRHAVQQADELVAAVMQRLTNGFAEERSSLERQWDRGDSVSTEDLRVALQRYRSFFGRLLNVA